ncbi:MAG: undecaprenyl-diphosphate phosphatase [Abditibacteriaceae bacterium]
MHLITWWQSALLGLAQGLTEFIPVSSSAHLNILHWIFGQDRKLTYDVLVSIGTTIALAWYFRKDWKDLLLDPSHRLMRNLILLTCVPAAIAGLLLRHLEDTFPLFTDVRFNAVILAVAGLVLWLADVVGSKRRELDKITWIDAILIGSSQAFALIPGVSRSGSTITAGLFLGLKREDAARFSFLMSLPITIGATIFEMRDVIKHGLLEGTGSSLGVLLIGILISAVAGFWAIDFLLKYLRHRSVAIFAIWRLVVAFFVLFVIPHLFPVAQARGNLPAAQITTNQTHSVPH